MSDPVPATVSPVLKRRTVKPTEQRRAEILKAALACFSSKGFQESTVEDVANAAGVAKGTIYLYFRSKEHVLLELKQAFMSGLVEAVAAIAAAAVERIEAGERIDHRDVIDDIFQAIVDYHCEKRDAVEVVVRQSPGPDLVRETLDLEKEFIQLLTGAFTVGNDYGIVETTDPEMTARLVNAAIRDTLAACLCYQEPADLDRLVEASKQLLYKALSPDVDMPPRRPRLVRTKSD